MGDIRYTPHHRRVAEAEDPVSAMRELTDEEVIQALAASAEDRDRYLSNVLAVEAMNRVRRKSTIVESAGEGLIATDLEGRLTFMNPAAQQMFGWDEDEVLGKVLHEVIHYAHPDGSPYPFHECPLSCVLRTGEPCRFGETVMFRRDGSRFPADVVSTPLLREGEVTGAALVVADITERRRREGEREALLAELQAERARLRAVMDQMPSALVIVEAPSGRMLLGNEQMTRIFRQPLVEADDVAGYAGYRGIHPDGRPVAPEEWPIARAVTRGEFVRGEEFEIIRGDDTRGWITVNAAPILDASGELIAGVAIFDDITERKRAEETLRYHRALLEAQQESIVDGVVVVGEDGRVLQYNQRFLEIWGFPPDVIEARDDNLLLAHAMHVAEDPEEFLARVHETYAGAREPTRDEVRLRDGRVLDRHGTVVVGSDGRKYGWLWSFRDVTGEREAARRLRVSEQRYRSLFEHNPEGVSVLDTAGSFVTVNRALERLSGYTQEELQGLRFTQLVAPEDLDKVMENFQAALMGEDLTYDATLLKKGGERATVSVTNIPLRVDGEVVGVYGLAKDVTLARQAEEARRESKERIERILESITDAFFSVDASWRFDYVNAQAERVLQRPREELLGRSVWDEFPEAVGSEFYHQYHYAVANKVPTQFEAYFPPLDLWADVRAYPSTGGGLSVFFVDASERKRLTEALAREEARYRALYENTPSMYFRVATDGTIIAINRVGANLLGYAPEELEGKPIASLYHPGDQERLLASFAEFLADPYREPVETLEYRKVAKDGHVVWVREGLRLFHEPDGTQVVLVICDDITESKRREALFAGQTRVLERVATGAPLPEVLDLTAREMESAVPGLHASILVLDPERGVLRHGAAPSLPAAYIAAVDGIPIGVAEGSCGTAIHRREPVVARDIATDPLWEEYRAKALEHGLRACWSTPIFGSDGVALGTFAIYYREVRQPTPWEERLVDVATDLAAIAIEQHRRKIDLQESQRDLEGRVQERTKQLRTANRELEAFTYLVTHDLKEPIRAVEAYLRALREDHGGALPEGATELVERADDASRRLGALVNGLLELSRAAQTEAERAAPLTLRTVLAEETCDTRFSRLVEDRGATLELGEGVDVGILGTTEALCQVLGNLVVNAIEHNPSPAPRVRVSAHVLEGDGFAEVVVEDNGPGFPEDVRAVLNDPDGSGRSVGFRKREGGGFGMAIARRVVERLGGRLSVGVGNAFGGGAVRFTLPLAKETGPGT